MTLTDVYGNVTDVIKGHTSSIYGKDNILTAVGYAAGTFFGWQTDGVLSSDAEARTAGSKGYLKYPTGLKENPYSDFQAGDVRFVDQMATALSTTTTVWLSVIRILTSMVTYSQISHGRTCALM